MLDENHEHATRHCTGEGGGMSKRDPDSNDCALIECEKCGKVLNGLSLWIVGDKDPKTICEECHQKRMNNARSTKNTDDPL